MDLVLEIPGRQPHLWQEPVPVIKCGIPHILQTDLSCNLQAHAVSHPDLPPVHCLHLLPPKLSSCPGVTPIGYVPISKKELLGKTLLSPQVEVSQFRFLVLKPRGTAINQVQFSY